MLRTPAPPFRWFALLLVALFACQNDDAGTGPGSGQLRVKLYYVGGRAGATLRVSARKGATTESATVGSSDEVALGSRLLLEDSVEIRVEELDPTTRRFHPAIAVVRHADLRTTQKFVLIPRRWTITADAAPCRYAGQTIDIDVELAYTRSVADASSFYWRAPDPAGGWTYRTATFPKSQMPIPVAFDHAASTDPISDADSAGFWGIVGELESELCGDLFRPATRSALPPGRDVIVLTDRNLDATARGGPNSGVDDGATVLVGGVVICRTTACITASETIRHELLHVLGFGHSCAWPTIMRAGCTGTPRASEWDAAYYQLYYAARAIQLANGAQYSLGAAHQGERVILHGLPIEPAAQTVPAAAPSLSISGPPSGRRDTGGTRRP